MMRFFALFFLFSLHACPIKVPEGNAPNNRSHRGHYPFISWTTFQRFCADFIIDEYTDWFDPDLVKRGDIIFLNFFYLNWFVEQVHDTIKQPYILICCDKGGWAPHPGVQKILYDPKLAAWFCRNMVFSHHPKLFQLPMGQDVGLFSPAPDEEYDLIRAVVKKPYEKNHILYMNFFPRAHGDRIEIMKFFEHQPYCYAVNRSDEEWTSTPRPLFYEEMASSQFVLSPLGYETDCVRTWEALALGAIPIIEHSFLDPLFAGLPVVMVHDWKEIDLPFLEKHYAALKGLNHDKIYFDYWKDLILYVKKQVQDNNWLFAEWEATDWPLECLKNFEEILADSGNRIRLVYKGFLSASHPFQLASYSSRLSTIHLFDPWLSADMFHRNHLRFQDPLEISRFLHASSRIFHLRSENELSDQLRCADALFLDLTYYRTSLFLEHFYESVIRENHFRHSLKRDIELLYEHLPPKTLLFGNMANDPYVSECLDRLSKENQLAIGKNGPFWTLKKPG